MVSLEYAASFFGIFIDVLLGSLYIRNAKTEGGGRTICWIPLEGLVVSSKGFNAKEVFF